MYDRHALHEYMWRKADRMGRIKIIGTELAEALGTDKTQISSFMKEFKQQGRVRVISRGNHGTATYIVADPAPWREPAVQEVVPLKKNAGLSRR